jgi:hypothetical protein
LKPGTGVILRLALCYERLGKTASAWGAYRVAAARAQLAGDDALKRLAAKRAEEIEPRVPSVSVRLPSGVETADVDVQCDGVVVDHAALASPLRLDPGSHTLQASARGRRTFRKTFTLDGSAPVAIDVELAPSEEAHPAAPPPENNQRTVAFVTGGVGIVGVGVGTVFGLLAISKWNDARSGCASGTTGCTPGAIALESTVRTDALVSTIAFGVGAVGLAAATVLYFTAPRETNGVAWSIAPTVGGGRIGAGLSGRF